MWNQNAREQNILLECKKQLALYKEMNMAQVHISKIEKQIEGLNKKCGSTAEQTVIKVK